MRTIFLWVLGVVLCLTGARARVSRDAGAYNVYKQKAVYGGALVLDTPVKQFAVRGPGYTHVAPQQLKWCHDNGVVSVVILSPSAPADRAFLDDTRSWAMLVTAPGHYPRAWAVENYVSGVAPGMGDDQTPGSVLGTALYIAEHFPIAPVPTRQARAISTGLV